MLDAEHVAAELLEHLHRREAAREQLRRAQEDAAAAEHRLARAMTRVLDAAGIITAEAAAIDRLLEQLHDVIPRQRPDDDNPPR